MIFSSDQLSNIPHILSEPRFATYLQHCNNDRICALQLYQWNLELSAAFVIPLHLLEVSIRNAAVECVEAVHTSNWPWNQGFIRRLPNPKNGYSPTRDLENVAKMKNPTMGKVVAELKFVFWEKMFTSRHDKRLWNAHINAVFPNVPAASKPSHIRAQIYNDVSVIRNLRNRIAHHEPIFSRNNHDDYEKIYKLIRWRNVITADWMQSIQTVTQLISERPT
jgi:hypothetical protein